MHVSLLELQNVLFLLLVHDLALDHGLVCHTALDLLLGVPEDLVIGLGEQFVQLLVFLPEMSILLEQGVEVRGILLVLLVELVA